MEEKMNVVFLEDVVGTGAILALKKVDRLRVVKTRRRSASKLNFATYTQSVVVCHLWDVMPRTLLSCSCQKAKSPVI